MTSVFSFAGSQNNNNNNNNITKTDRGRSRWRFATRSRNPCRDRFVYSVARRRRRVGTRRRRRLITTATTTSAATDDAAPPIGMRRRSVKNATDSRCSTGACACVSAWSCVVNRNSWPPPEPPLGQFVPVRCYWWRVSSLYSTRSLVLSGAAVSEL